MINIDLYNKIKLNWDRVAKPLDSMGKFEEIICRIGAILENERPELIKNAVVIFASDNGIVNEGISQSGQDITALCTENIANMQTSVCAMAKYNSIEVIPVDVGVNKEFNYEATILRNEKIAMGTKNFLKEKAMTKEELNSAIEVGKRIARELKDKGYEMVAVGEIGIGNTTTSSAVAAALLKCDAGLVTGRGAGLSDEKLIHKINVINEGIKKHNLYEKDVYEILSSVGGFDIAAMVGLYLGAKEVSLPIILDGVISMVAGIAAVTINEGVKDYLIPSHLSREPAAKKIVEALDISPVIDGNMALGEGTGAVMMIGLIKTAYEVYRTSCKFAETDIKQYERWQ